MSTLLYFNRTKFWLLCPSQPLWWLLRYANSNCTFCLTCCPSRKIQEFCPKIECNQMKPLYFVNSSTDWSSKSVKIWLSKWVFYVKSHHIISEFFEYECRSTFLQKIFFDSFNFQSTLFTIVWFTKLIAFERILAVLNQLARIWIKGYLSAVIKVISIINII